ncbi:sialidase family protein [Paenibacillus thalictri]|uniref:Exo-alpha-sialidase n=1 Tax=Paenibacillus thalictri TaxID=2527873 RepID=A0A4Q9DR21_9BACL|nr:sialidase family protein [Paenibacillus thalictri]TBL79049.1 exo-alpha-sialidase [Paenibacillus thalictri]
MQRTIVMDNMCGWPNLTQFPDGSLISSVFNHPSHGLAESEVDCYRSVDGGYTWHYHGTPAKHEPERNRMNVACGLAANGDFLVLAGGWDRRPKRKEDALPWSECNRLPAVVCRSNDQGKTFTTTAFNYSIPGNENVLVPYGDMFIVEGNRLACACYTCSKDMKFTKSYIVFSDDDGYTWTSHGVISEQNYHETALWFHDSLNGIAISRKNLIDYVDQFGTTDGGKTWTFQQRVTMAGVHPAHVTRLDSGFLLMTCGIRLKNNWGIGVCVSKDGGDSWSRMAGLCNFGQLSDGGYPATVQLSDGELLTHYYASGVPFHERYFVGQVKWQYSELF